MTFETFNTTSPPYEQIHLPRSTMRKATSCLDDALLKHRHCCHNRLQPKVDREGVTSKTNSTFDGEAQILGWLCDCGWLTTRQYHHGCGRPEVQGPKDLLSCNSCTSVDQLQSSCFARPKGACWTCAGSAANSEHTSFGKYSSAVP